MDAKKLLEIEAQNDSWSHAYLLIGNEKEAEGLIQYIIEQKKIDAADIVRVRPEDVAGKAGEIKVDEIRECLRKISLTSLGKIKLAIIYSSEKLNQSSGNVLLKSLEEPCENAIFIMVASVDCVLSTIKSRCRTIYLSSEIGEATGQFIDKLKNGFFEASQLIEKVVKEEQTEFFLNELVLFFHQKLIAERKLRDKDILLLIEEARKDIRANANARLVLENLYLEIEESLNG